MKKKIIAIIASTFILMGALASCSANSKQDSNNSNSSSNEKKEVTIKVGASITPHAEILEHIKPKLKEQGINLEVVTLDDEGQLNPALDEKQIDANYFQHVPYLESVSKEKGYNFEVAGKVHIEPIGLYSNKIKSINDLKDGDKIGIPNNPSNEYRALVLLEKNGLIKLKSGLANYSATPNDIAENPKHLQFVETDAAQLPRALGDLAGAVINTNIILDAKIDPNTALIRESGDSPYANIVVVRKGDKDRPEIQALVKALTSDDVKNFIKQQYGVAVVPAF
ncbi:MetQ/NlpA family ABC transporter substrate-binding protein [Clostridium saccharoperbutylacetonicum]|uniref:Lipoprotein n=1 Tax=Clostridium saccharoperbutylacetonicum N1-4(HMT) TaxID=931276 RepID=M1MB81_9CLOT|nr:MetQ/NlpA family ABC transporter substrate-binding protein [Clostridium saccharoperbutylacetonicum]AGF55199.1 methionine-binding lipoprotein MetQ [Clostridium saccharoperbutylacetonicum N1-4(HMT)]AQR94088.1 methionine-binding lipoprotein MetQ precursor [Clostridium saccharoperbutylacetonicum]NRT64090.1 D-methionine transport system substrate-binding protein [Clostridium saccharoperbutylacetonicum]NSB27457.1 D-methionine transport system substrate-binding protein [Clostridium saccharoperbutyl